MVHSYLVELRSQEKIFRAARTSGGCALDAHFHQCRDEGVSAPSAAVETRMEKGLCLLSPRNAAFELFYVGGQGVRPQ